MRVDVLCRTGTVELDRHDRLTCFIQTSAFVQWPLAIDGFTWQTCTSGNLKPSAMSQDVARSFSATAFFDVLNSMAKSSKTIFVTCKPREEVLKGELREQQFAASLTKVLRGNADDVYGDPTAFFGSTYPTGGLKALLRESLGRLTSANAGGAAVIRLETSFGGGKTHNLIALYHLCCGEVDRKVAANFCTV